jgi:hypothetical protein
MDDYEIDDEVACPECGRSPIHYRDCRAVGCEDGTIDGWEEDPLYFAPGEGYECKNCGGTGIEQWCPNCAANLSDYDFDADNETDDDGEDTWPPLPDSAKG